ncbi:hypothetical protein Gotri_011161, partial [Gossypium trilobum]|nr:hypothetical protein [Gossypium trilobum]
AGFWHVANISRGCKLDPKLISAFIKRWRPKTHTFHLPCGSVPSLWRTCSYNWSYRWMGPYSPSLLNLLIRESYATIFWVRF